MHQRERVGADPTHRGGKLREAEAKLSFCTATTCPGPVRDDCAERLDEVQRALPTIVFDVRSAGGAELSSVRVSMDGEPLTSTLEGGAIAVDPGQHTFAVSADGYATWAAPLLVLAAEKGRIERLVLQPLPTAAAPDAKAGGAPVMRTGAFVALGVGAAGVAVWGLFGSLALANNASLDQHCNGGACPPSEDSEIHSRTRTA